jgi:hypothetical protein
MTGRFASFSRAYPLTMLLGTGSNAFGIFRRKTACAASLGCEIPRIMAKKLLFHQETDVD